MDSASAEQLRAQVEEMTGLSNIATVIALPDDGTKADAVVDYSDPTDLFDSESAAAVVVYSNRSPAVIAPTHAIQEGTSEVLKSLPLSGGTLVIACSDGSVGAQVTLATDGPAVLTQREQKRREDEAAVPGWLKSLENIFGSASKAVVTVAVVVAVLWVAGELEPAAKAVAKAAEKAS